MSKPANAAELRALLIAALKKYEDASCTILAMTETLKRHGIPIDEKLDELAHSDRIRGLGHSLVRPLIAAIEHEDAEELQKALLSMRMPEWKM